MKKFNLKRAIITVTEIGRFKSDHDLIRHIKMYQAEIVQLKKTPNFDRKTNKGYLEFQRQIEKLRHKLKNFRSQRFTFEVYIKQYKQSIGIDWQFQHEPYGTAYQKAFRDMLKDVTNKAIQECRGRLKSNPSVEKFGPYISSFLGKKKKFGRVFAKDGEILRLYVEKNIKTLYVDKVPTEPRKYIGIELEFCAPIKENNFALKLFKKGIHKFAQLKADGSLRPHEGEIGYELAILLEESNYKKRLKQITTVLAEVGAVAKDRRAGLHVHLDMRKRDKDLVYNNLVACQYALLSIVDPKRYNNEFCRVVESRKFPTEFTGQREERYRTINAAAFYKYKTLEVRIHEGSVDYTQISNWVDVLIRIANYNKKMKSDVTKISMLGKRIELDKKLYSYLQDRSCFWQVRNEDHTRVMRNHIEATRPQREAPQRREINRLLVMDEGATVAGTTGFATTVNGDTTTTFTTTGNGTITVNALTQDVELDTMLIERTEAAREFLAHRNTNAFDRHALEQLFPPDEIAEPNFEEE